MRINLKFYLIFTWCLLSVPLVFSQKIPVSVDKMTDAQVLKYMEDAERKGLSEREIETAALSNGYTYADIAKIRERVNKLKVIGTTDSTAVPNETIRKQMGEVAERTAVEVDDRSEIGKKKEIFGREIFRNKILNFEPNLRLPTPANYVLGPDDELKIDISGYAYQHYDLTVSPEGTVKLESLAPIYVNGLSIADAKKKIVERLKVLFGGLRNGSLTTDVTLGNVRSIQVTVSGEVENPGSYTVSSMASVYNALYLSGGPNVNGSMRNIQLIRNNKVIKNIDLYDFLTKGLQEGNINLQDQDLIFIPFAERKIELEGEFKRNAIYELKSNENLEEAIKYAGGFTEQAYKENLNITRYTAKEKKLLSVEQNELSNFFLQNGDLIHSGAVLDRFENKVEIIGAVFRPGEYALDAKLQTLSQLISRAEGFREDAFKSRVLIQRERENLDPQILSFDLRESKEEITLQRNDIVIIKSLAELREERYVEIEGAINQAGQYKFADNMRVSDLILMAGGLQEGASHRRIEISKRLYNDESSDKSVEIINIDILSDLSPNLNAVLSPFDKVFVRDLPNYQEQQTVTITGEINYPGIYTVVNREDRISDLIQRAGNFRPTAYPKGARFYREGKLVALDLNKTLKYNNKLGDLILSAGDSLYIPKTIETVTLSGQLLNPTTVGYQPDFSFSEYIAQAGGYTDSAFVRQTYVRYANGLTDRTRSFAGIKRYPKVEQGMQVIVPTRHRDTWTGAERIAIGSGIVSLSAVLLTLIRVLQL